MSTGGRITRFTVLTVLYSFAWFYLLFLIVGFFMPTPVAFNKKMRRKHRGYTGGYSRYGLSDDRDLDEAMYYDTIDD